MRFARLIGIRALVLAGALAAALSTSGQNQSAARAATPPREIAIFLEQQGNIPGAVAMWRTLSQGNPRWPEQQKMSPPPAAVEKPADSDTP